MSKGISARFHDENVESSLERIRAVRAWASDPVERVWNMATMVSHVDLFRDEPQKLDDYGRNVIASRLGQLFYNMKFRTFWLTDLYLKCVQDPNPFALFFTTRAQLELYSVCWEVSQAVAAAQDSAIDLVRRMTVLDE